MRKQKKRNTLILCKGLKKFLTETDDFKEKPTAKNFE